VVEKIKPSVLNSEADLHSRSPHWGFNGSRNKMDTAVIEVGLGVADATNIVTALVSVITSLSYDHMAVLGNTSNRGKSRYRQRERSCFRCSQMKLK
jgi:hypothetical protein